MSGSSWVTGLDSRQPQRRDAVAVRMCPRCHHHLVEVDVRLGDVTVTMHACSNCDTRWWDRDGRRMGLDAVLALAGSGT